MKHTFQRISAVLLFTLFILIIHGQYAISGLNDENDTNQYNCTRSTGDQRSWIALGTANYDLIWSEQAAVDGVYFPSCCGDDSSENLVSMVCAASGQAASNTNFCNSQASVISCCLDSTDCVYGYDCYDQGAAYAVPAAAYCEAGQWFDCDSSEARCDSCSAAGSFSCAGDCWIEGGETTGEYADTNTMECCGDDANENRVYRYVDIFSFEDAGEPAFDTDPADEACCNLATDCVDEGLCFASGTVSRDADGDGDDDYCYLGIWYDCGQSAQCDVGNGMGCIANNCVDVIPPVIPSANYTITDDILLYGYIEEPISVNISTRSSGSSQNYYHAATTSGPFNWLWNWCQLKEIYVPGSTEIFLKNCNSTPTVSQYIRFQSHNRSDFTYYDVSDVAQYGQEFGISLSQPLRYQVTTNEWAYLYLDDQPSGYFTYELPFTALQEGANYIYIWGTDYADNPNSGPARRLGPIDCIGSPPTVCMPGCGMNPGEYPQYFNSTLPGIASNLTDTACCYSASACSFGGSCFNATTYVDVDGNGDTDYCLGSRWYDCHNSTDCPSGFSCDQDHQCVDVGLPMRPRTWTVPQTVNESVVSVIGWINETVNVTARARNASSALSYFESSLMSGGMSQIHTSCAVDGSYNMGINTFDLICVQPLQVQPGRYIQFAGHNGTYFERYLISSSEQYTANSVGVVISRPLEHSIGNGEQLTVESSRYPSGWFNVSVSIIEGTSLIRVWGTDENGNAGEFQEIGPIYYETSADLVIWDSTRTTVSAFVNDTVTFYANYTNSTNNMFITGANCSISYSDNQTGVMGEVAAYQHQRSFSQTGVYQYSVNCSIGGMKLKTASSSITIYQDLEKPVLWDIPAVVNSSWLEVIGFSNSSLSTVNVYTSGDPSYMNSSYIPETIQAYNMSSLASFASEGATRLFVPQSDFNAGYFAVGKFIQFSGYDYEYFRRYSITSVEDIADPDYAAVNISPALASWIPQSQAIFIYGQQYPLGWFNLSVQLQFNGYNVVAAFNNKSSFGPSSDEQTVYLDTQEPMLSFPMNHSNATPFTFVFSAIDDYEMSFANASAGGENYTMQCVGSMGAKSCSTPMNLTDGWYDINITAIDSVGNREEVNLTFLVDTTVSQITGINDTGELTAIPTLNASWTPYIDDLSSVDHYEYAVGTAAYPQPGWDSVAQWTSVSTNYVSAGPLALTHGVIYYFSVRAKNSVGSYTAAVSSDGIVYVDNTPPLLPWIADSGIYTSSATELSATWNSSDPESSVAQYDIAIGTSPYPGTGWYSLYTESINGNITQKTFPLTLVQNETYYFTIIAKNPWEKWSQRNSSDGITVDTTPPLAGWINYSIGNFTTNSVVINFSQGQDNESGISDAELWYGRLEYRDNTCSGSYLFDNYVADVAGSSGHVFTLENGYCYKFMLRTYNGANLSSNYHYYADLANTTVIVDSTPPTNFTVSDEGAVTYNGTRLRAAWTDAYDLESGIDRYEYRIEYTVNNGPRLGFINWTRNNLSTTAEIPFNLNHSNLSNQYKYYFDVRAYSRLGLFTSASSDGIIYMDIYPPQTSLLSVGGDTTAPYLDENFGNVSINVTGELNMKCVYSQSDIDYSDSASSCLTSGSVASCNINLSSSGNYTYHVICSDVYGNGQDFDENIDVSFEAFVYRAVSSEVNISSDRDITIRYTNSTGSTRFTSSSDSFTNTTVFENFLYDIVFDAGRFILTAEDVNVSATGMIQYEGRSFNISQLNLTQLGARYVPRDAFIVSLTNISSSYLIRYNYSGIAVGNENALMLYRIALSGGQPDYSDMQLITSVTRDTGSDIVSVTTSRLSLWVLVHDTQMPEICSDHIDNNGNGLVDENCSPPPGNSGGSSDEGRKRSAGGSDYYVFDVETCFDNTTNQDETDVDCGGICTKGRILKFCALGKMCAADADCAEGICHEQRKVCYKPTCFDLEKNQDETEVDCGGQCKPCGPIDTDGDGLLDDWELKYGFDISDPSDAMKDPDNDGLSNLLEFQYKTDPLKPDTDGDGYDDMEEVTKKTDPLDPKSKPKSCKDGLQNQGEEGIDCGGPCEKCPEIEEPRNTGSILGFLLVGIIVAGGLTAVVLVAKRRHPQELVQELSPRVKLDDHLDEPAHDESLQKEQVLEAPAPRVEKRITLSDEEALKLQAYADYIYAAGRDKQAVRQELEKTGWPEYIVDVIISDLGDQTFMRNLLQLDAYSARYLKGFTHEEMRKHLRLSRWEDQDIDLLINDVHKVTSIPALKDYLAYEIVKGTDDIEAQLRRAGWPRQIVSKTLLSLRSEVKADKELAEKKILKLFTKGLSEQEVKAIMIKDGFNEDIVSLLIFTRYSIDKNVERVSGFVNQRLLKGDSIEVIRKMLISAGWGIDVIDRIVTENFRANDMKYLIALDRYFDEGWKKGYTKAMIEKELLKQNWASEYIDMVMLDVHIVDDKIDKIKAYANLRLSKGDSIEKIKEILVRVGWGRKVVEDTLVTRQVGTRLAGLPDDR